MTATGCQSLKHINEVKCQVELDTVELIDGSPALKHCATGVFIKFCQ